MDVQLLKHLGNIDQIAGIRESRLTSGRGEGIAIAEFYNAAGLRFTVLPDRGMDTIPHCTWSSTKNRFGTLQ